ncbi:TIA1 cytotoxic granule associated RNA binding protein Rox8 [Lycorma delicatula]|uniref:TIA1 cytotoxic granule associated RNA binding protein Rox8 n=1 Tax=Lycorma delicatula TaxID=130591 RepID=UPI003F516189
MSEESHPRTLYVGNLDSSVSDNLLCTLFSQIGEVKGCKVIREPGNDPYAFLEFTTHQGAATALTAMNKRLFLEKEMKVNWATSPGNQPKTDTSNHYHVFVGDLSPEIETQTLKEAFAPFGEISNCRIVRDPQTLKSKGYAFVSFVKKAEAESAIATMNGQWLGNRSIRTNWSTRKPPPPRSERNRHNANAKQPTFDEVYNQSSPTNCTVYCGGFTNGLTDELVQKIFSPFGTIQDIRAFKDKGYAFIKFSTKEAATHAIEAIHNTEINGSTVKCFWGKESGDPNLQNAANATNNANQPAATAQYPYVYGQHMGYWYPQAYAASAAQMQGQYLQGMQPGYTYGQFGYQQGYVGRMGMQLPATAWQGMPTPTPVPATAQQMAVAAQGAAMQQPGTMMAYTMPQFQTQ